jgi:hypothetical protein
MWSFFFYNARLLWQNFSLRIFWIFWFPEILSPNVDKQDC